MRYDKRAFDNGVNYYKKNLGSIKGKTVLAIFDVENTDAYYSLAPLSRAVHLLGADIECIGIDGKSESLDMLQHTWRIYEELKKGTRTERTQALGAFIKEVKKRYKGFERILKRPELVIWADNYGFVGKKGLSFKTGWFRPHKEKLLAKTCKVIWTQVYNLKKKEKAGIGFETIPKARDMEKPLEDYLDSFPIARAMMLEAKKFGAVGMSASTSRLSMLDPMTRVSDLRATLLGCELSKGIDEPVFRKFRKLSPYIGSNRLKTNDATFFIRGKGYGGEHGFGQYIGYPDPKKRTRWQSPGMFLYKLDYFPQTKHDERMPRSRIGFTETLPIDIFIQTCNIDWLAMKNTDDKLKAIANKSERILVRSNLNKGPKTEFEVGLVKPDGSRRIPRGSDVDVREKINKDFLRRTGHYAGNMANLPGGEMFVTPEYIEGTIVGDVVINIDQSYVLDERSPIIVHAQKKGYTIKKGPKKILEKLDKKKKEAWKTLKKYEKNKSLPKEIIELKKKNFNGIGEFAVNTNPKAKLCDYLIVNEKIANMIHVALGSGFEADKSTEYHMDIVIDARRQKLDIFGVGKTGKKHWILKGGKFA